MFVVMLTSTPTGSGIVRSQSSEAQSRTSMHGNVYQPNEELFERGHPNSFPFSSNEDDTEKDSQEVNCCRYLGYKVKDYNQILL